MSLIDNITVTNADIFKGSVMIAYGNLASFPGELESVIHPTTYVLAAGLTQLGPTTEDGVPIHRAADVSDGIPLDQRVANLREGEPEKWTMDIEATLLHTTDAEMKVVWELPEPDTITGSVVTQTRLSFGAPPTFTERQLYIIQEDPSTSRLRVAAFRKTVPQPDSTLNAQSNEVSGLPSKWLARQDTTLAQHHGPFGFLFTEAAL